MEDVVFKNGTLLVNLDVEPDQVKSVIVSRKDSKFCDIFLRSNEVVHDAIPAAWIENEIEWLRGLGNHFANLTAMNIESMLKRWREQQESEEDKDGRGR